MKTAHVFQKGSEFVVVEDGYNGREWQGFKSQQEAFDAARKNGLVPDRAVYQYAEKSRVSHNSAINAKFKVGDIVYLGGVEKMEVVKPTDSHGWTKCKYLDGSRKGMIADMPTPELRAVKNSSNPVVANAVAWKAKNAIQFGVGNKVMHHDSKMRGTIVGKYNDHLWNVKWDAGFTEPAHPDDLVFISMH